MSRKYCPKSIWICTKHVSTLINRMTKTFYHFHIFSLIIITCKFSVLKRSANYIFNYVFFVFRFSFFVCKQQFWDSSTAIIHFVNITKVWWNSDGQGSLVLMVLNGILDFWLIVKHCPKTVCSNIVIFMGQGKRRIYIDMIL